MKYIARTLKKINYTVATLTQLRYAILPNILVPLAGASTDIYLPSLPHMALDFSVNASSIQLTITSFVLAMALGQYLAGPVSDALGRKSLIITSLIFQLMAVLAIVLTHSMPVIILARAIQGIACAFMIVPARALLNDNFTGVELKKKFNYLTMSFALAPIVAPFIGGYGEHYFGWHASFYFLLVYIVSLLFIMVFFTKETIKQKRAFSLIQVIHNYSVIIKKKSFLYPTFFISIVFGYTSINNVLGPFLFQTVLGLKPIEYGYVALTVGGAWFVGNLANRVLFNVPYYSKLIGGLVLQSVMIFVLLVLSYCKMVTLMSFLVPLCVIVMSAAMMFSVLVGECLSQIPELAASSNAFLFASTWFAFGIYTYIATYLPTNKILPMLIAFVFINMASYLMLQFKEMKSLGEHA